MPPATPGIAASSPKRWTVSSANTEVLDVTGRRHRGLLTADDFARWSATVEDPVGYDYHGHTVLKCGPWSQGPVFLQQLALLKGFDIGAHGPARRASSCIR